MESGAECEKWMEGWMDGARKKPLQDIFPFYYYFFIRFSSSHGA
jgi:hypothetical protein